MDKFLGLLFGTFLSVLSIGAPAAAQPGSIYRATFNDNVRISQEERQLAWADLMHVDFLQSDSGRQGPAPMAANASKDRRLLPPRRLPLPLLLHGRARRRVGPARVLPAALTRRTGADGHPRQ